MVKSRQAAYSGDGGHNGRSPFFHALRGETGSSMPAMAACLCVPAPAATAQMRLPHSPLFGCCRSWCAAVRPGSPCAPVLPGLVLSWALVPGASWALVGPARLWRRPLRGCCLRQQLTVFHTKSGAIWFNCYAITRGLRPNQIPILYGKRSPAPGGCRAGIPNHTARRKPSGLQVDHGNGAATPHLNSHGHMLRP